MLPTETITYLRLAQKCTKKPVPERVQNISGCRGNAARYGDVDALYLEVGTVFCCGPPGSLNNKTQGNTERTFKRSVFPHLKTAEYVRAVFERNEALNSVFV